MYMSCAHLIFAKHLLLLSLFLCNRATHNEINERKISGRYLFQDASWVNWVKWAWNKGLYIYIGELIFNGRGFIYFSKSVFVGGRPSRWDSVGNKRKPIQLSVLNPWRDLIVQNSLWILVHKHSCWVHSVCQQHAGAVTEITWQEAACTASSALAGAILPWLQQINPVLQLRCFEKLWRSPEALQWHSPGREHFITALEQQGI